WPSRRRRPVPTSSSRSTTEWVQRRTGRARSRRDSLSASRTAWCLMSQQPIDRSPDLKRLRDEGYDLDIVEAYLVVRGIPYLAAKGDIRYGTLFCAFAGAGTPPPDHTAYFVGAYPCHADGAQMSQIVNSVNNLKVNDALTANYY